MISYFIIVLCFTFAAKYKYFSSWNLLIHCILLCFDYIFGLDNTYRVWSIHLILSVLVFIVAHIIIFTSRKTLRNRFLSHWYMIPAHILMHVAPIVYIYVYHKFTVNVYDFVVASVILAAYDIKYGIKNIYSK